LLPSAKATSTANSSVELGSTSTAEVMNSSGSFSWCSWKKLSSWGGTFKRILASNELPMNFSSRARSRAFKTSSRTASNFSQVATSSAGRWGSRKKNLKRKELIEVSGMSFEPKRAEVKIQPP